MTYLKKQKARLEELSNNISERLTGRKPVRNEVTSERVYCRIISVGRAIARSYWYYPQYTILFTYISPISVYVNLLKSYTNLIYFINTVLSFEEMHQDKVLF